MQKNRNWKGWIKMIPELGKFRIAQLVTISTATGYILAKGSLSFHIFVPVFGVLILALGSGALNQYQEREKDALMPRTRRRPIPSGRLSPAAALTISIILLLSGTLALLIGTNLTSVLLGLLTVLWYNGVYTYLKRITPLAVVPGSLIGSLPPLIGWASAGGNIFTLQPLILALFFFIWQIPHFWLLLLNFGQDYELAGYPSLTAILSKNQLGRITFMWIVATAASIMLMPFFGIGNSLIIYLLLFMSSIALVWRSVYLLNLSGGDYTFRAAFHGINVFVLSVMLLLALDRLINFGRLI